MDSILSVQHLDIANIHKDACTPILKNINFELKKGKVFALVGESGSGKSMTANAIMQLLPSHFAYSNASTVYFFKTDLLNENEKNMRKIRGNKISMVFQEPMSALNPVMTIGKQIAEVLFQHKLCSKKTMKKKVCEILRDVGLEDQQYYDYFPHQLSGGMRQRVVIALAIAASPEIIIADEPTTALDAIMQQKILNLLIELARAKNVALLLITHDLSLIHQYADEVGLIYYGEIIEKGNADFFMTTPLHPYAKQLFATQPSFQSKHQQLSHINGSIPRIGLTFEGCIFAPRCQLALAKCKHVKPTWKIIEGTEVLCHLPRETLLKPLPLSQRNENFFQKEKCFEEIILLKVENLVKTFKQKNKHQQIAVNQVGFSIKKGECFALIGGSGSGKSTVAKLIAGLEKEDAGKIYFLERDLSEKTRKEKAFDLQLIFQDPYNSLNPKLTILENLLEALQFNYITKADKKKQLIELIIKVGLSIDALDKFPHEFSGGQRQRIAIARAIAIKPQLIICDEPTSALDISVQAQILNLLKSLQHEYQLTLLLITHNFSVVGYMADRVAVMHSGHIVEMGTVEQVLYQPQNEYTKLLIKAGSLQ